MTNNNNNCGSCQYMMQGPRSNEHECRYGSPQLTGMHQTIAVWPVVRDDDWCGKGINVSTGEAFVPGPAGPAGPPGPEGPMGPAGANAPQWFYGNAPPTALAQDGDWYLQVGTGGKEIFWQQQAGVWVQLTT